MGLGDVSVVARHHRCQLGEGPYWRKEDSSLLMVDSYANQTLRLNTKENDGDFEVTEFEDTVSIVIPCVKGNEYVVTEGLKVLLYDFLTKERRVIAEVEHGQKHRFNDGKCDARGRLFLGTMERDVKPFSPERNCHLYYLPKVGEIQVAAGNVGLSNGLAWHSSQQHMFYVDSLEKCVVRYEYDPVTARLGGKQVVVDKGKFADGFPDGIAIDSADSLWVAVYGAGCVRHFDLNTGQLIEQVDIPGATAITSCCFGGDDLRTLYVTSASKNDVGGGSLDNDGKLFKVVNIGATGAEVGGADLG